MIELAFAADIDDRLKVAVEMETLVEALGSVLENAAMHARETVSVTASALGDRVSIVTSDDGDGIAEDRLVDVTLRGVRLDETGTGHGLGLAIVADIAADNGGSVALHNGSPGLTVILNLPAADRGGPQRTANSRNA